MHDIHFISHKGLEKPNIFNFLLIIVGDIFGKYFDYCQIHDNINKVCSLSENCSFILEQNDHVKVLFKNIKSLHAQLLLLLR